MKRSYRDECDPHWYERCPVHGRLVKFDGEGHRLGLCDKCMAEAARALPLMVREAA